MGVLLLLLFTVPSVYSLVKPQCNVSSEYKQHSSTVCQSGCEDGWQGIQCRRRCPEFCLKCDRKTGNCFGQCKDGYFGTHCLFPCHHCSARCDAKGECINSTTTTPSANTNSCRPGWFGPKCQHKCNNCNKYGCEKQSGICHECREGYFGYICSDRCSENCILNYDNINKSSCSRDSGQCLHGCVKGWFGDRCEKKCSKNCIKELCENDGTCLEGCHPGWFGPKCKLECNNCNQYGCQKQTGICHVCREGYFGDYCLDRCSENCNDNINRSSCNPKTGQCLYGCVKGWFGDRCEKKCSLGCRNGTCNKMGTKCSEGCIDGRYGDTCNKKCSKNCIKQICENDGTCPDGCYPGWTGSRCLQKFPKPEGYATKFELIIAFSLFIIVPLAAYVIRKKMKNTKHKEPNSAPESVSLSGNTSTVTDHYDQINESQLESFSDISSNNSQQIPLCFNNNNNNQVYLHPIVEDVFIAELS